MVYSEIDAFPYFKQSFRVDMKKYLLLAFIVISSSVYCMIHSDDVVIAKLKSVLVAGRYVYSEHKTIHAHAKSHAIEMIDLFNINEELLIADRLKAYATLLEQVMITYLKYTPVPNQLVVTALESSHRSCLKWALTIASGRSISRVPWKEFRAAFREKRAAAHALLLKAEKVQTRFAIGDSFSKLLPIDQAVTAWCVSLPEPKLCRVQYTPLK